MSEQKAERPQHDDAVEFMQPLWDVDGEPTNETALYMDEMELYAQRLEADLATTRGLVERLARELRISVPSLFAEATAYLEPRDPQEGGDFAV